MASSLLHLGGGFSTEAMSLKVRRFLPPSWVYEHMLTMKLCVCVCVCVCVFLCVCLCCVCDECECVSKVQLHTGAEVVLKA